MGKKETVIINVSYLVDLNEEELKGSESILHKITSKLGKDEQILINEKSIGLKWKGTSSYILDPTKSNCGKCTKCSFYLSFK